MIKVFSSNQWVCISVVLFVVCLVFAGLFLFGASYSLRKTSFYVALFSLLISILFFVFSSIRKDHVTKKNDAIVMVGVVVVKSSPDKKGTDLFQLHEGTKVTVKSTLGEWMEVEIGNGNIGWLEAKDVERI
jgi:Bacterial SH3 domain.